MRIVECVPNFSEGRDRKVIDEIAREISSTAGVRLLDVDPGPDANRTVVTFAGEAEAVGEAAFRAVRKAAELIDMRRHRGTHPRMGATDVCPFVPVSGIGMDECVALSKAVARRVGEELGIPVFLYEKSASADHRRSLADIRRGEYEGMAAKMLDEKWRPDFGPRELNPAAGATVMGARPFLIAYNVNLDTTTVALARRIAREVREKKDGTGLPACRAIGWDMPGYGCVQISMNLVDYAVTPPHAAFEEVRRLARDAGLRVTGSEIVGLVPMEALLMAGRFYLGRQGRSGGQPQEELIAVAVRSLGLDDVAPFDPAAKILEKRLGARPLADVSVAAFVDALSSDRPSPGGGSAAALSSAIGAGLIAMVAGIGWRKGSDPAPGSALDRAAVEAQALKERFLGLAADDEEAYGAVVAAHAMPSKTEDEKRERDARVAAAMTRCVDVPLQVMEASARGLDLLRSIMKDCPANVASDTAGAFHGLRSGAATARAVVLVNLKEETLPPGEAKAATERLQAARASIDALCADIEAHVARLL